MRLLAVMGPRALQQRTFGNLALQLRAAESRLWRMAEGLRVFWTAGEEALHAAPTQQMEEKVHLPPLAEGAGVPGSAVALTVQGGDGFDLLAQRGITGRGLDALAAQEVDDDLLRQIWKEVASLREAHVAHRDLRRENVLVDAQGKPWIVDFRFAETGASERLLAQDVAGMLASLACTVGAARSVATALDVLGREALGEAAPLLQPQALPSATPHLLEEVRRHVAELVDANASPGKPWARFQVSIVAYVIGAALATCLLLPQFGELRQAWQALRAARWEWLVVGLLVVPSTYFAAAMALRGAVNHPLPLRRTALVQLAGSFVNKLTPKGFGGMGVNGYYLERSGVERPIAFTGIALNMTVGMVIHVVSLMAMSALLGLNSVVPVRLPDNWLLLAAGAAAVAALAAIVLTRRPDTRRRVGDSLATAAEALLDILRTPARAVELFIGVAGVTVANVLTLTVTLHAVGASTPPLEVGAVYLGGAALASASPTPGNLGAMEAVLVANLTTMGVQTGPAVAGVLVYRLLGFWLPIIPGLLALRYLRRKRVL